MKKVKGFWVKEPGEDRVGSGKTIIILPKKKKVRTTTKPKLVLISKRSKRIDGDIKCAKCGVVHNPGWEYAESSHGRVVICTYCKPTKAFVRFTSGSFESGRR
ncbi:hypothetical protein KOM00_20310 [Geomonas sp. Red69]|uniref:hypothetical protein n=1 Tax=Geomonas diazotrophica TaxID=2843197 RepID=UPI001C11AAB6|nr:hypothetical protein [Geomonas diazotrophica]MBU5639069.1 hypothetical protein [Geomonas diazotrophica]